MRFLIIFTFPFTVFLLFLVQIILRYEGDFDTKGVFTTSVSMLESVCG